MWCTHGGACVCDWRDCKPQRVARITHHAHISVYQIQERNTNACTRDALQTRPRRARAHVICHRTCNGGRHPNIALYTNTILPRASHIAHIATTMTMQTICLCMQARQTLIRTCWSNVYERIMETMCTRFARGI
jgi:hypothetical protein